MDNIPPDFTKPERPLYVAPPPPPDDIREMRVQTELLRQINGKLGVMQFILVAWAIISVLAALVTIFR